MGHTKSRGDIIGKILGSFEVAIAKKGETAVLPQARLIEDLLYAADPGSHVSKGVINEEEEDMLYEERYKNFLSTFNLNVKPAATRKKRWRRFVRKAGNRRGGSASLYHAVQKGIRRRHWSKQSRRMAISACALVTARPDATDDVIGKFLTELNATATENPKALAKRCSALIKKYIASSNHAHLLLDYQSDQPVSMNYTMYTRNEHGDGYGAARRRESTARRRLTSQD